MNKATTQHFPVAYNNPHNVTHFLDIPCVLSPTGSAGTACGEDGVRPECRGSKTDPSSWETAPPAAWHAAGQGQAIPLRLLHRSPDG